MLFKKSQLCIPVLLSLCISLNRSQWVGCFYRFTPRLRVPNAVPVGPVGDRKTVTQVHTDLQGPRPSKVRPRIPPVGQEKWGGLQGIDGFENYGSVWVLVVRK